MARPIRTLSQRLAAKEVEDALSTVTTTERLLARILIELMNTRRERTTAELAQALQGVGFSKAQAAGILGTTTQSVRVAEHRRDHPVAVDAVREDLQ
jgi:hypothetical protein